MTTITAKIVADSIANGIRLTTMELVYPRFIHAESKTHRIISLDDENYEIVLKQSVDFMKDSMLSRSASSSRAIPVRKMLEQVKENPAMPIHWGLNQPGMQADTEYSDRSVPESLWKSAAKDAVFWTKRFNDINIHKQVSNRLLDTFQHIKVIVTATEWDNFFKLRLDASAQPEMRALAKAMKVAMDWSIPTELGIGKWHLPYVDLNTDSIELDHKYDVPIKEGLIKLSVARCARVSYLNHDKSSPDIKKDIELADKLVDARHMGPLEHQLTPMEFPRDNFDFEMGVTHIDRNWWKWSGNSRGWLQYRHLI